MGLPRSAAVPSRETLRRFGNTSPASTFYILAHLESRVRAASQHATPDRPGLDNMGSGVLYPGLHGEPCARCLLAHSR